MSAVVIPEEHLAEAATLLELIRAGLKRHPGHALHWKNIKSHTQRLRACQLLAEADWLTISSVGGVQASARRRPAQRRPGLPAHVALPAGATVVAGQEQEGELSFTMTHVVRFELAKLRDYEALWRDEPDCQVAWDYLDARGGQLDQPSRVENLQLADLAASATGGAFNKDELAVIVS